MKHFTKIFTLALLVIGSVVTAKAQTKVTEDNALQDGDRIIISKGEKYYEGGSSYTSSSSDISTALGNGGLSNSNIFQVEYANETYTTNEIEYNKFYLKSINDGKYIPLPTGTSSAVIGEMVESKDEASTFIFVNAKAGSTVGNISIAAAGTRLMVTNYSGGSTFLRVYESSGADFHNGNQAGTVVDVYKLPSQDSKFASFTYYLDFSKAGFTPTGTVENVTANRLTGAGYDLPTSWTSKHLLDFCTLSLPEGTFNADSTMVKVTVTTENYPVKFSSSIDDATWYLLKINSGYYLNNNIVTNPSPSTNSSKNLTYNAYYMPLDDANKILDLEEAGNLWAFVGNPYDGFKIYNAVKADDNYKYLASTDTWNGAGGATTSAYLSSKNDTIYQWNITKYADGKADFLISVHETSQGSSNAWGYRTGNDNVRCLEYYETKAWLGFTNNQQASALTSDIYHFTATQSFSQSLNDGGNKYYYSTLYLPFDVTTDENTTAYTGKVDNENSKVIAIEVKGNNVPLKNGVLLKGSTESATLTITGLSGGTLSNNDFEGVLTETENSGNNYVFSKVNDELGFYLLDSSTLLKANRAYIPSTASTPQGLSLTFGEAVPSAISTTEIVTSEKDAPLYDLSGRCVNRATKGVYIQNGKKIILK